MDIEDIRKLAKLEREMSEGTQPYVVNQGQRWAFSPEAMARCGLKSGQEVSDGLLIAIMEASLALYRDKVDAQEWPEEV